MSTPRSHSLRSRLRGDPEKLTLPERIETDRLRLVPVTSEDAADMRAGRGLHRLLRAAGGRGGRDRVGLVPDARGTTVAGELLMRRPLPRG